MSAEKLNYKLKLLWQKDTNNFYLNTPMIHDNKIFIEIEFGKLSVLDIIDGAEIDDFEFGKTKTCKTPLIIDNTLYVSCNNNYIKALNLKERNTIWSSYIEPRDYSNRLRNFWELTSPSIEGRFICVKSQDSNIYLVNRKTGRLIWEYNTGNSVLSPPVIYDRVVYFVSNDKYLKALDESSGNLKWRFYLDEEVEYCGPEIVGSFLFIAGKKGTVFSINTKEYKLNWKQRIGKRFLTKISANEKLLVAADAQSIYCLDPVTGRLLWVVPEGGDNPVVFYDLVLCVSQQGELLVIDGNTGKVMDRYNIKKRTLSSQPVLFEDKIILSAGNSIYCFQLVPIDI